MNKNCEECLFWCDIITLVIKIQESVLLPEGHVNNNCNSKSCSSDVLLQL